MLPISARSILEDQASRLVDLRFVTSLTRQVIVYREPGYLALDTNVTGHVPFHIPGSVQRSHIDPYTIRQRCIPHDHRRTAARTKPTLANIRRLKNCRIAFCKLEPFSRKFNECRKSIAIGLLTYAAMAVATVLAWRTARFIGHVAAQAPTRPNLRLLRHEAAPLPRMINLRPYTPYARRWFSAEDRRRSSATRPDSRFRNVRPAENLPNGQSCRLKH